MVSPISSPRLAAPQSHPLSDGADAPDIGSLHLVDDVDWYDAPSQEVALDLRIARTSGMSGQPPGRFGTVPRLGGSQQPRCLTTELAITRTELAQYKDMWRARQLDSKVFGDAMLAREAQLEQAEENAKRAELRIGELTQHVAELQKEVAGLNNVCGRFCAEAEQLKGKISQLEYELRNERNQGRFR